MSAYLTDLFAGFGGASTGASQVPDVVIKMAANHDPYVIDVHNANHPNTDHACVDLHMEDPRRFPKTELLWASPECTKWSQGAGAQPAMGGIFRDWTLFDQIDESLLTTEEDEATRSRLLMFDVLRFIEFHRYLGVVVENVADIAMNPKYAAAWRAWQQGLINLGYEYKVISLNSMHAQVLADPAPQSRDRLYIVAWPKGNRAPELDRFVRPQAYCPSCSAVVDSKQAWKNGRSVGKYRSQYVYLCTQCLAQVEPAYLPASTAIDWTLPAQRIGDRARPLSDNTRRRIAAGIARYWQPVVVEASGNTWDAACEKHPRFGDPESYYRAWPTVEPLRTLSTDATRGVVQRPEFIAELRGGGSDARLVTDPLSTVTAGGNHHGLLAPYYGSSTHAAPTEAPIGTLTTRDRFALIQRHNTARGDGGQMLTPVHEPLRTFTTTGHQSIVTPGDLAAAEAQVDDCTFRMLQPHEIGAGMAFPSDYIVSGSKSKQVQGYGNAVTPPAARDLIGALAHSIGVDVFS